MSSYFCKNQVTELRRQQNIKSGCGLRVAYVVSCVAGYVV